MARDPIAGRCWADCSSTCTPGALPSSARPRSATRAMEPSFPLRDRLRSAAAPRGRGVENALRGTRTRVSRADWTEPYCINFHAPFIPLGTQRPLPRAQCIPCLAWKGALKHVLVQLDVGTEPLLHFDAVGGRNLPPIQHHHAARRRRSGSTRGGDAGRLPAPPQPPRDERTAGRRRGVAPTFRRRPAAPPPPAGGKLGCPSHQGPPGRPARGAASRLRRLRAGCRECRGSAGRCSAVHAAGWRESLHEAALATEEHLPSVPRGGGGLPLGSWRHAASPRREGG